MWRRPPGLRVPIPGRRASAPGYWQKFALHENLGTSGETLPELAGAEAQCLGTVPGRLRYLKMKPATSVAGLWWIWSVLRYFVGAAAGAVGNGCKVYGSRNGKSVTLPEVKSASFAG